MSIEDYARRVLRRARRLGQSQSDHQLQLLNEKMSGVIDGIDNQARLFNDRLSETVQGIANQSELINNRLRENIQGIDNQTRTIDVKLEKLIDGVKNQSQLFNRKISEVVNALNNLSGVRGERPTALGGQHRNQMRQQNPRVEPRDQPKPQSDPHRADRQNQNPVTDLEAYRDVFKGIQPWKGYVPPQFIVDFLGMLIDIEFHPMLFTDPGFNPGAVGGGYEETVIPHLADAKTPADAEAWFEAADWVTAAREARNSYVMITLGANYGAQAVGAYRALQAINPLPYKLVAVDPVPENVKWIRRHMSNNGIDPDQQWILPLAISDNVEPMYFPVGGPGIGSNNAYSTNEKAARLQYAEDFITRGMGPEALRNLLVNNTTGLTKDLVPGQNFKAEIKLVSSITLNELLGSFEMVDLLESDIQQSEILAFPPFIDLLRRKVRRIHIGTHGGEVHTALHELFAENGWKIVFSFPPNSAFRTALGAFETNDGVLTVRNPDL
jgi:hypothetical protein